MRLLYLLITLAICQISLAQKGLYVSADGFLLNENSVLTIVNGDFVSASNIPLSGGTLQMKGLDAQSYRIELSNENNFNYLELYGTSVVELDGQLVLNRELLFEDASSFEMTTGSHVTLGPTAEIVGEDNVNTTTGADGTYMVTTRDHTAGMTNDFGLIGVEVRNGTTSMGSTEIYRRYGPFDIDGNPTVNRYYEIHPLVNSDLDVDARFYLLEVDLNGLERSSLAAFKSTDNGTTFTNEGGTAGTMFHSVENIDAFSIWTFANEETLTMGTIDAQNSIMIFPNPASFSVNVVPNGATVITFIELATISGQKIPVHLSDSNTIDVSHLSDGIYFLKIISQHGALNKKLIVKK